MQFEEVYIHKYGTNELGYRNGVPKKAGRFLYIDRKAVTFFPHLSSSELNDNILIDIINKDNIISTYYVFFNSKTASKEPKEKRSEYRLYITKEIDIDRNLFKPNDIVVFTKYEIDKKLYFKINLFSAKKLGVNYHKLDKFLIDSKTGKREVNHLLVNLNLLNFLKIDISLIDTDNKTIPEETINSVIDNQKHLLDNLEETAKIDKVVPLDETGLIKSNNFRELVLFAYTGQCAITGKSIKYQTLSNLEVAHIMPKSHNGPNAIPNGIALSRDLHWAFDKGFFTIKNISNKYIIDVHQNVKENEIMKNIDGIEIFTPADSRFRLHNNALKYHQKYIFGTFKQIRSRTQV